MTTQTEINRSVHEAMSKCVHEPRRVEAVGETGDYHYHVCTICNEPCPERSTVPDYCSDLNATTEFMNWLVAHGYEVEMGNEGGNQWYAIISTDPDAEKARKTWSAARPNLASAICEAGLKALGQLEEGE